jgi:hypothetical protein
MNLKIKEKAMKFKIIVNGEFIAALYDPADLIRELEQRLEILSIEYRFNRVVIIEAEEIRKAA